MVALGWVTLVAAGFAAGLWTWFALSPARRNALGRRLEADQGREAAVVREGERWPGVAIIVPARNEADAIGEALPTLAQQDYPGGYRVVLVDDQSEDATPLLAAEVAAAHPERLIVHRNQISPPAGWVGKPWAVHQGVLRLREAEREAGDGGSEAAEWLCFTDADIVWHPAALQVAMGQAVGEGLDVVSLFPRLDFSFAGEKFALATMVQALCVLYPFEHTRDPKKSAVLTAGAFMLVRRELYEQVGGHTAVAGEVVEDLKLGQRLKAAGARVDAFPTQTLLSTKMYRDWRDLWEGLTKNAYAGLDYRPSWAAGVVAASLVANVLPPLYAVAGVVVGSAAGGSWLWWSAGGLGLWAMLMQQRIASRVAGALGLSWGWSWQTPIGSLMYVVFVLASVWRYYRGGNVWKGRTYGPQQTAAGNRG